MLGFLGSGLSGLASLGGSLINANAANSAAKKNALFAAQENALTREYNERMMREGWAREEALQREFATHGIQWKAADARAAGINPAFALGAPTTSFSSSVGIPQATATGAKPFAGESFGSGVAALGQDISRALQATRSEDARTRAYTEAAQVQALRKGELENQLLASQIARLNGASVGPPMPTSAPVTRAGRLAQGDPKIKDKPLDRVVEAAGNQSQEPGKITDQGYSAAHPTKDRYFPVLSKDVQERLEDDIPGILAWNFRNRVLPTLGFNYNPPTGIPLKKGKEWLYHPIYQEYWQVRSKNAQPVGRYGSRSYRNAN